MVITSRVQLHGVKNKHIIFQRWASPCISWHTSTKPVKSAQSWPTKSLRWTWWRLLWPGNLWKRMEHQSMGHAQAFCTYLRKGPPRPAPKYNIYIYICLYIYINTYVYIYIYTSSYMLNNNARLWHPSVHCLGTCSSGQIADWVVCSNFHQEFPQQTNFINLTRTCFEAICAHVGRGLWFCDVSALATVQWFGCILPARAFQPGQPNILRYIYAKL